MACGKVEGFAIRRSVTRARRSCRAPWSGPDHACAPGCAARRPADLQAGRFQRHAGPPPPQDLRDPVKHPGRVQARLEGMRDPMLPSPLLPHHCALSPPRRRSHGHRELERACIQRRWKKVAPQGGADRNSLSRAITHSRSIRPVTAGSKRRFHNRSDHTNRVARIDRQRLPLSRPSGARPSVRDREAADSHPASACRGRRWRPASASAASRSARLSSS